MRCDKPLWKSSPYSTKYEQLAKHAAESHPTGGGSMKACGAVMSLLVMALLVFLVVRVLFRAPSGKGCGGFLSGRKATAAAAADGEVLEPKSDKELAGCIAGHPVVVVMFMAPWCGHCKAAKPAFHEAAKLTKGAKLCMANCADHISGEVAQKHGVEGFPTFLKFLNGKKVDEYKGDRSKESIAQFCDKPVA